jgi:hypothetical protein
MAEFDSSPATTSSYEIASVSQALDALEFIAGEGSVRVTELVPSST